MADSETASGPDTQPGFWRQMKASLPRNVIVLGIVSFLTDSSSEMILWTVPFYIALLGGGAVWVGIVEGLRESLSSLLKLASGWFCDRVGRRKALVVLGYGISTVAKPLLALAAAPWHVLGLLGIERMGKGVRAAPRDALIAGVVSEANRGKAFSFHRMMDHGGAVLGLLAGTVLAAYLFEHFRWKAETAGYEPADVFRFMYLLAAIPAALAVVVAVVLVREKAGDGRKGVALDFRAGYDRRRSWCLPSATLPTCSCWFARARSWGTRSFCRRPSAPGWRATGRSRGNCR